jgi:hypothetical protein
MMLGDFVDDGGITNNLTRPQNVGMIPIEVDDSSPIFTGDELVDLRSDDAMLDPGDLVEIRYVPHCPCHILLLLM